MSHRPAPRSSGPAFALAAQQQRLLTTTVADSRRTIVAELDGPPPTEIDATFAAALARHEILRTSFPHVAGRRSRVQAPLPTSPAPAPQVVTVADDGDVMPKARALASSVRLDPEHGITTILTLVQGPRRSAAALTASPLVADARSLGHLLAELLGGDAAGTVRFAGFASWQRREQGGEAGRDLKEELAATAVGDLLHVCLPLVDRHQASRALARVPVPGIGEGTAHDEVLAAWVLLLGRICASDRLAIVTADAGRAVDGLERAVGPFEATVPVLVEIEEALPLPELSQRIRTGVQRQTVRAHLFDWEWLTSAGDAPPPFGYLAEPPGVPLPGARRVETSAASLPCLLTAIACRDGVELAFDEGAVSRAYATELAGQLGGLLRALGQAGGVASGAVAVPGGRGARGPQPAERSPELVHRRVAAWAAAEPDRPAVTDGAGTIGYGALWQQAEDLAGRLHRMGVGRGAGVGALVGRDRHYVVTALASARLGATFVPFDPSHSVGRLRQAAAGGVVDVVVTQGDRGDLDDEAAPLPVPIVNASSGAAQPDLDGAPDAAGPDDACYAMYTSGSSGLPRLVTRTYGHLAHYAATLPLAIGLRASDRFAHTAPLGFSSSVRQTLVALTTGAEVVVVSDAALADPPRLLRAVLDTGVTVLDLVPSLWRRVLVARQQDTRLREDLAGRLELLLSASEPLPADVAAGMLALAGDGRVVNMYGQTETTGIVTATELSPDDLSADVQPLGRPLPGLEVVVLDDRQQPVPVGFSGAVHVAGPSVGGGHPCIGPPPDGYTDVETQEGALRLYDTGDTGLLDTDGVLRWRGRKDRQVKVRGFRVELGEAEAGLARHPAVADVAVVAVAGPGGDTALRAFVVPRLDQRPTHVDLTSFLVQRVPTYLIPASVTLVSQLPRNANGKVDREALASGAGDGSASQVPFVTPRTPTEEALARILTGLLDVPRVGAADNIFDLGMTSLLGIDVMARVRGDLDVSLPWTTIFANPTVEQLAERIDRESERAGEGWTEAVL